MAKKRTISKTAEGKHIGHACEGHFRGLLKRIVEPDLVLRELPFDFPVEPDAVVVDEKGRVELIGIVAFWKNSHNSESKFYRTRLEYQEALRAREAFPHKFSQKFRIVTVLYGAKRGWKEKVLEDLADQCAPLLFLPDELGTAEAQQVVSSAFQIYKKAWLTGKSKSREIVENEFQHLESLKDEHLSAFALFNKVCFGKLSSLDREKKTSQKYKSKTEIRVPVPFQSRYRQGLSLLSLFSNEEIAAWLDGPHRLTDNPKGSLNSFIRRAYFLDLLEIKSQPSLRGVRYSPKLREPKKGEGENEKYAPDRPDFVDWCRINKDTLLSILERHRTIPLQNSKVFSGGCTDQVAGNFNAICSLWADELPKILKQLRKGSTQSISSILAKGHNVYSEAWQPTFELGVLLPLWDLLVCTVATNEEGRGVWSEFFARKGALPENSVVDRLSKRLVAQKSASEQLLKDVLDFSDSLLKESILATQELRRPSLLELDNPCSWLSCIYNSVTSNSTHNPLCIPVFEWLQKKYPKVEFNGWPKNRSVSISRVFLGHGGRRQWQFLGESENQVIAAEVKSITANNWGNKSKEIYDRLSQTRIAAKKSKKNVICIGILDGDFFEDQITELNTEIGYDTTYSIDEILTAQYLRKRKN